MAVSYKVGRWVVSLLSTSRPAPSLPTGLHPNPGCAGQWVHLLPGQGALDSLEPTDSSLSPSAAASGHSQKW